MIDRPFWRRRLEDAWREAPVAWLSGVRRVGKTTLARSLDPERTLFLDCDLPVVEEMVRDPALFFRDCEKPVVVFDEVHRLADPRRVLKIGADLVPRRRVLATGSSTLTASRKFRDTLAGRKRTVHLEPVLLDELPAFGATLARRLYHGGLPQALLAGSKSPSFYREWMDSFFAYDIQAFHGFRSAERFNALFEYLLVQSGGLFDRSRAAAALGIARPTVNAHVEAMEAAGAVALVRPYHGNGLREIVKMPRVYGFDTGFVSFARGWDPLRPADRGVLWEHLVLETLRARHPDLPVRFWRDTAGREVDFVLPRARGAVDAVECKWNPDDLDPAGLEAFRALHPGGRNFLVVPGDVPVHARRAGKIEVTVCGPAGVP